MNTEQQIQSLQQQVQELQTWKEQTLRQQLSYPLDDTSKTILNEDQLVFTGKTVPITNGVAFTDLLSVGVTVTLNNVPRYFIASSILQLFTVVAATDILTSSNHGLSDGQQIAFISEGTLPTGLDTLTAYYVISSTVSTFKVSLTYGGSAVDITSAGTGPHYWGRLV